MLWYDLFMKKLSRDERFMSVAIAEAKKSKGPKRFGAVIVKAGRVIAQAHNTSYETQDPITCAEVLAISKAARILKNRKLIGCAIYTTGESCLMCTGAILKSRMKRVVVGFDHRDYNRLDGRTKLNPWSKHIHELIPPDVKVIHGVLRQEAIGSLFNPKYRKTI